MNSSITIALGLLSDYMLNDLGVLGSESTSASYSKLTVNKLSATTDYIDGIEWSGATLKLHPDRGGPYPHQREHGEL